MAVTISTTASQRQLASPSPSVTGIREMMNTSANIGVPPRLRFRRARLAAAQLSPAQTM